MSDFNEGFRQYGVLGLTRFREVITGGVVIIDEVRENTYSYDIYSIAENRHYSGSFHLNSPNEISNLKQFTSIEHFLRYIKRFDVYQVLSLLGVEFDFDYGGEDF